MMCIVYIKWTHYIFKRRTICFVCCCSCRNGSHMRRITSNSNFSMPVCVRAFLFFFNFILFNLCVFSSCVTRFDSYFIAIFDVKILMRNEKVLIKPENFLLVSILLLVSLDKKFEEMYKHNMIVYLMILII